jgi:hypothetical protein
MMADARNAGQEFVEINAGELHKRVGGYPPLSASLALIKMSDAA